MSRPRELLRLLRRMRFVQDNRDHIYFYRRTNRLTKFLMVTGRLTPVDTIKNG